MTINKKLKMLSIKNLEDRIALKLPKIDNFHSFLMKFLKDLKFPSEKILKFDRLFNETWDSYFFEKYDGYEIDLFVDEDYVMVVLRFPKNERKKIMKIIHNNFFFPDEEIKDALIKIEVDDAT